VVADNDKASDNSSELLRVARERFKLVVDAESEIREAFLDDFKFRAGDQWPENIKVERKSDNRPALVINRIPQHVRQITNDQRQNRPSIKVAPVDDNADVETAKIFQGVIRHIERNSSPTCLMIRRASIKSNRAVDFLDLSPITLIPSRLNKTFYLSALETL
jgi:hypothetical protein